MNTEYFNGVLARPIVEEALMYREHVSLYVKQNPFLVMKSMVDSFKTSLVKLLEEPTLLPVYCFEYAPDC